jgi:hypothetical protein
MSETISICETCREQLDPEDSDVVRAFEQVDVTGFGEARNSVDGLGVYFHEGCFPHGSRRYRLAG